MGDRRSRRRAHGRGAGKRARRAVRPRLLALKPGRVLIGDLAEKSCVGLVRAEALLLDVAQGGLVHTVGAPPVRVAVLVLVRAPPGLPYMYRSRQPRPSSPTRDPEQRQIRGLKGISL